MPFIIHDLPPDIAKSLEPLIWGAPPIHTSSDARGRRLFADGRWDRLGLPRLKPPPGDGDPTEKRPDVLGADRSRTDKSVRLPQVAHKTALEKLDDMDIESDSSLSSVLSYEPSTTRPVPEKLTMALSTKPLPYEPPPPASERDTITISDSETTPNPLTKKRPRTVDEENQGAEPAGSRSSVKRSRGKARASDVGQGDNPTRVHSGDKVFRSFL